MMSSEKWTMKFMFFRIRSVEPALLNQFRWARFR